MNSLGHITYRSGNRMQYAVSSQLPSSCILCCHQIFENTKSLVPMTSSHEPNQQ